MNDSKSVGGALPETITEVEADGLQKIIKQFSLLNQSLELVHTNQKTRNFSVFDQFVHECAEIGIKSFQSRLRILTILLNQIGTEFDKYSLYKNNDNNNDEKKQEGPSDLNPYSMPITTVHIMVLDNIRKNIREPSESKNNMQHRLSVEYIGNAASSRRSKTNNIVNKQLQASNDAVLREYISELVTYVNEYTCEGCGTLQPATIDEKTKKDVSQKNYANIQKNDISKEFGSIPNYIFTKLKGRQQLDSASPELNALKSWGSVGIYANDSFLVDDGFDNQDTNNDRLELPTSLPDGWTAQIVNIAKDSNELMFVHDRYNGYNGYNGNNDNNGSNANDEYEYNNNHAYGQKQVSDSNIKKQRIIFIDNGIIDDKNKKEKISTTYPLRGEKIEPIIDLVYKECIKEKTKIVYRQFECHLMRCQVFI